MDDSLGLVESAPSPTPLLPTRFIIKKVNNVQSWSNNHILNLKVHKKQKQNVRSILLML